MVKLCANLLGRKWFLRTNFFLDNTSMSASVRALPDGGKVILCKSENRELEDCVFQRPDKRILALSAGIVIDGWALFAVQLSLKCSVEVTSTSSTDNF